MPSLVQPITESPTLAFMGAVILCYVFLCSSVRMRRVHRKQRELNYRDRKSMSTMTNAESQRIIQELFEWEFPTVFRTSLQFGLFKTYGIPTISDLLVATSMFSTPENASKRYEDTSVLIGEYLVHAPNHERSLKSIARMNYLHKPYIKAGKISNDDLLYTLSVFIIEPIRWINQFEWRNVTEYEVCALATFWKGIGDAMGIDYDSSLKRTAWEDGFEFYEDIKQWAENYEAKKMVPTATNKKTADELVPLLLHYVPQPLLPFSRQAVGVLIGKRLRYAMIYPEPSRLAHTVTHAALYSRKFFLRYLTLPRFSPVREFTEKDPQTGRYHHNTYLVHPYYVSPSFRNRWGPSAWITWAFGGIVPGGKHDKKYYPEGYIFEEVGPDKKRGLGGKEMGAMQEEIKSARPVGCPFKIGS